MFEAYRVGVTLSVTNKVSSALAAIASDFAKTDRSAKTLVATLGTLHAKQLAILGAVTGGAGLMGLHLLKKAYGASTEYEKVFAQFKAFNLGDAINDDADKFARGTNVFGASSTKLIGTLRDLETVFGSGQDNYQKAKRLAPLIAQMEYANQAVGGEKAMAFNEAQRRALAKVIERRGGFESDEAMRTNVDYMQHVMSGTGFMVLPNQYQALMQRGGIAALRMSPDQFYFQNEPMIQEMSGSTVGTGLMTAYNRLVLGMSAGSPGGKAYIELLDKIGQVDKSMIERNKLTGRITKVKPGFLKGTQDEISRPYWFLENVIVPGLRSIGYDEDHIQTAISQIYGRTGGNLFGLYHAQYMKGKIGKNVAMDVGAMNTAQLIDMARNTPNGAELAFHEAENRFATALGRGPTLIATRVLLGVSTAINLISDTLSNHPWLAYTLAGIAGAFSLLATAGGGLMLAGAGIKLLSPAITALTGLPLASAGRGLGILVGGLGAATAVLVALDHASEIGSAINGTWADKYNPFLAVQRGAASLYERLHGDSTPGAPPSTRPKAIIDVTVNDPYRLAKVVTQVQSDSGRVPPASGNAFDGRLHPNWGF